MQLTGLSTRIFIIVSLTAISILMAWGTRSTWLQPKLGSFHSTNSGLQQTVEEKERIAADLKEMGVTENLGSQVSLQNLEFKDEVGKPVLLDDYFKTGRPIILTPVYYECPNLCNFLLNGFVKSIKKLDWTAGKQFEILTYSINPKETEVLAQAKKASYLKAYGRDEASGGWHFLTGNEDQIQRLSKEVGFGYKYDPKEKQYGHSAALIVLTPTGKISRYLYGIEFKEKDLRLALLEASNGKIGNVIDRILLYCFQYDPQTRKYSLYSLRLMEAACLLTVVIFGGYLAFYWRRQRKGA